MFAVGSVHADVHSEAHAAFQRDKQPLMGGFTKSLAPLHHGSIFQEPAGATAMSSARYIHCIAGFTHDEAKRRDPLAWKPRLPNRELVRRIKLLAAARGKRAGTFSLSH